MALFGGMSDAEKITLGVLFATTMLNAGMLIQQVRMMWKAHDRLEDRFDDHVGDRTIHPDGEDIARRLGQLEGRPNPPPAPWGRGGDRS